MSDAHDPNSPPTPQPPGEPPRQPDPATTPAPTPKPTAPPRRRSFLRRHRWALIFGGFLLVLLILVALLPTIASSGWARSMVLSRLNDHLNARVEIASWSVSWGGPTEVRGLRVIDSAGRQILQVQRMTTELSAWDVVRGRIYDLGRTTVEGADALVEQYPDGTTNFHRLEKVPTPPAEEPAPGVPAPAPAPAAEPLPDLRGDFDVAFRATFVKFHPDGSSDVLILDPSTLKATVAGLDEPIRHEVKLALRSGDSGTPGHVNLVGQAKLFDGRRFDLAKATAEESLTTSGLDLSVLRPLLGPELLDRLGGTTGASFAIRSPAPGQFVLEGSATATDVAIGGALFDGDAIATRTLKLTVPPTTYAHAAGTLRTGSGPQPQPITLAIDQGQVTVLADGSLTALMNVLDNARPGAAGTVATSVRLDLAQLSDPKQLRRFLRIRPGVTVARGTLEQDLTVTMTPQDATVALGVRIPALEGTRTDAAGKPVPINLKPIALSLGGRTLGGGGVVPEVRDVKLEATSGFGTLAGGGTELSKLKLDGTVRLADLRAELGQFRDLGDAGGDLAGTATLSLRTEGELDAPGSKATVTLAVVGEDLVMKDVARRARVALAAKGTLVRGQRRFIEAIDGIVVAPRVGAEQGPATLDGQISGSLAFVPVAGQPAGDAGGQASDDAGAAATQARGTFKVDRLAADLARLAAELPAAVPVPEGTTLRRGTLTLAGAGSFDSGVTRFTGIAARAEGVDLARGQQPILTGQALAVELDGSVTTDAEGLLAQLSKLSVTAPELVTVTKSKDQDVTVRIPAGGGLALSGALDLSANLARLADLGGIAIEGGAGGAEPVRLTDGTLTGRISAAQTVGGKLRLAGKLDVDRLTSTGKPGQRLENEKLALEFDATAEDRFAEVRSDRLVLTSGFANVNARDVRLVFFAPRGDGLSPVPAFQVVQGARVALDVPSLGKVQLLLDMAGAAAPVVAAAAAAADPATPPETPVPAGAVGSAAVAAAAAVAKADEAAPASPPLRLTAGSVSGTVVVSRPGADALQATVDGLDVKGLKFRLGHDGPEPRQLVDARLDLTALVRADPADAAAAAPLVDQVREVRIPRLTLTGNVARASLRDPIVLTRTTVRGRAAFDVEGSFSVGGKVRPLTELIEVAGGLAPGSLYNYDGAYEFYERVTTRQGRIVLQGGGPIQDIVGYDGATPTFREKAIRLTNDLAIDQAAEVIDVANLELHAESSNAFLVKAQGKVGRYRSHRDLLDARLTLDYESAPLLELLRPMFSPELREQLATLKVSGAAKGQVITLGGKYPAGPTPDRRGRVREPIWFLTASGSLALPQFEFQGMRGENGQVPFELASGVLSTKEAPPLALSGGAADLSGFQLDLAGPTARLSHPKPGHVLLKDVKLTDGFADAYLESASPFFANATDVSGTISVRIDKLTDLPLGPTLKTGGSRRRPETGVAEVAFDIVGLRMTAGGLHQVFDVLSKLDVKGLPKPGLELMDVRGASLTLTPGKVASNVPIPIQKDLAIASVGAVSLTDLSLQGMKLVVPLSLIPQETFDRAIPRELSAVPAVREAIRELRIVEIPVVGTSQAPRFLYEDVVPNMVKRVVDQVRKDPSRLLQGILGGGAADRDRKPESDRKPDDERKPDGDKPPGTIGRPAPN